MNRYTGLRPARQRGVGMMEILIAVVLISFGFLAAARMQVQGMRFSQGAYFQSQAYFMANDMADRMRANLAGVNSGLYDGLMTSADASDPNCDVDACDPVAVRNQDLFDWSAALHAIDGDGTTGFVPLLPSSASVPASGQIVRIDDGIYQILMTWSEAIDGADTTRTLSFNFALETN